MLLEIVKTCNDPALSGFLSIFKRIMLLIQIIIPILLVVFASISLVKLAQNPELKGGTKRVFNQFLAAAIIFFIPLIINVLMIVIGEDSNFSSCWVHAGEKIEQKSGDTTKRDKPKKQNPIKSASGYE